MDNITDIPRCHYCQRFAPEISYEGSTGGIIHVCTKCLDKMDAEWYVYRMPNGRAIIASEKPEKLPEWEHIGTGSFSELWAHYYTDLADWEDV